MKSIFEKIIAGIGVSFVALATLFFVGTVVKYLLVHYIPIIFITQLLAMFISLLIIWIIVRIIKFSFSKLD